MRGVRSANARQPRFAIGVGGWPGDVPHRILPGGHGAFLLLDPEPPEAGI